MTKNEARKAAKIMLAYADGKVIERRSRGDERWCTDTEPCFEWDIYDFRIKTEPKYISFKDSDEAFKEMKKHSPFGWIKEKNSNFKMCILSLDNDGVLVGDYEDGKVFISYETIFKHHTFVDDSPIGIKEKEV